MNKTAAHVDRVMEIANSPSAAARSRLAASWRRSAEKHGLDPAQTQSPHRVDSEDLRERFGVHEHLLRVAAPQLERLFGLVGQSGCAVLLTDANGVILDQRLADADADAFAGWGLSIGANWSEDQEGTNGIGTCLAEKRQVIIHRGEHFFARNIGMSCIDAPIYGDEGEVVAALDVSSARADQTEAFNQLIAAQVAQTARSIEEAHFRARFAGARIVSAEASDLETTSLLAVDADDLVIGATRGARRRFGLESQGQISPTPARDLLGDASGAGFEGAERAAVVRALARAGGNVSQAARALGIGRATLYRRMKRLGLDDKPAS